MRTDPNNTIRLTAKDDTAMLDFENRHESGYARAHNNASGMPESVLYDGETNSDIVAGCNYFEH
jgi:hypothetical protein